MSTTVLRFLHASDFHLDRPLAGIADVPDTLRAKFVDAPFQAALAVVDAALDRRVDFLVLTGNLLDPSAVGPRGLAFLVEQFERLDSAGIAVYWLSGQTDSPERWPTAIELPPNVRRLDAGRAECITHWRDGIAVARVGPLAALPMRRDADEKLFTVGLTQGTPRLSAASAPFDYLAVGGEFARRILHSGSPWIVQSGSPQGRSIQHAGPHGCTLVEVDSQRHARVALRTCDAVRWREEQLSLDDCYPRARAESALRDRIAAATAEAGDRPVLLRLHLVAGAKRVSRSERERLAAEIQTWLRETFAAAAAQPVWAIGIDHEPAIVDDDANEQDTILGEFLRTTNVLAESSSDLRFDEYIGITPLATDAIARLDFTATETRTALLRNVSELGRELLGGEAETKSPRKIAAV
jgi:DNA repair protein SbcD/Mre11